MDMSTVSPETSRREFAAYAKKGVEFLHTPVFGSRHEAARGGLWVLAGGKREVFERENASALIKALEQQAGITDERA